MRHQRRPECRGVTARRLEAVVFGVEMTPTFDREHDGNAGGNDAATRAAHDFVPAPFAIAPESDPFLHNSITTTSGSTLGAWG